MISISSLIKLAIKNVGRKKLRATLSSFGILLGILLYTSMFVATESFKAEIESSITYLQGAIIVQQKGAPTPVFSIIDRSIEFELRKNLGDVIKDISPQIWFVNGSIKFSGTIPGVPVVGVFPEIDYRMGGYLSKVSWIDRGPPKNNETGWIVLGETIAKYLGVKVGDIVKIGRADQIIELRVIGIYKTGGISDMLTIASIIDVAKVDQFRDLNHTISSLLIQLRDPRFKDKFVKYIEEKHPELEIIFQEDLIKRASIIISSVEKFTYLIGFLALLIGFLGVTNTVFMNVSERRKEIGILKATGWRNSEVIFEVIFESLIIGIIGTLLGVYLGIKIAEFGLRYFGLAIRLRLSIEMILQPMIIGLVASTLAGLPPAWRAANISPIESLRE